VPKLIWNSPDGPKPYDIVMEQFLWAEIFAIQEVTGASGLLEIGERLEAADGRIIPALLWVLRKRGGEPTLTFADLATLKIGDIEMKGDDEDKPDEEAGPSQETPQTSQPPGVPLPPGEDSPSHLSHPVRLAT
jgi:hypothetical protein